MYMKFKMASILGGSATTGRGSESAWWSTRDFFFFFLGMVVVTRAYEYVNFYWPVFLRFVPVSMWSYASIENLKKEKENKNFKCKKWKISQHNSSH